jgi:hypothetical protein
MILDDICEMSLDEDTLSTLDVLCDGYGPYPQPSDVRAGVAYGFGWSGTLAVPSPWDVAYGIATDDTVGTAVFTIATQCQVGTGTIAPGRIEIYQGSAFVLPGTGSPVSISVVDQNQNPINLAGRTVELIATSPADTSTVLWRWTTAAGGGLTIVGAGSNVIQINADSTNSQTAGDFELFAWDITNGARNAIPEARCRLSIKAAPQP